MNNKLKYALLYAAAMTSPAWASEESFNLKTLQELFNSYQRQQAYDYASHYLAQQEGDPYFDYVYGVAAIDTGHASQGVFALERVLISHPDDHVARLELARGYFILEEYARARLEFEKVLAINPPQGVRDTTESFLEQIRLKEARYRTTMGGNVILGIGSDSNVTSGPDETLTLSYLQPENYSDSDTYSELAASWGVGHPFAPGWMATGNITASLRQNQNRSDVDTTNTTLQAGVTRVYKQSRYKADALYQQFQLDGDKYRSMSGIDLGWQYNFSQTSNLDSTIQYVALDYPTVPIKNSTLSTLSLTYSKNFSVSLKPVLFASINYGKEAAEDSTNISALADTERDILGYRIGTILAFSPTLALQMAAGIQTSDYAGGQTFGIDFGKIRQDDFTSANINLIWLINKTWRLDTKLGYNKNDSNIELYSYNRTTMGVELNYAF